MTSWVSRLVAFVFMATYEVVIGQEVLYGLPLIPGERRYLRSFRLKLTVE